MVLTYLLTYLLTPWCRVLLEKLTGLQLGKKFSAFHGTRRFITALTSVRHLSLSWASPIQSIYPHPTSWRSILILSTHLPLGLHSGSFSPISPTRPYTPPLLTRRRHMPSPSHSSRFYHPLGTYIYIYIYTHTYVHTLMFYNIRSFIVRSQHNKCHVPYLAPCA